MIKVSSLKRAEQRRRLIGLCRARFHLFSAISVGAIFFTYIIKTDRFTSDISIHSAPITITPFHPHVFNNHTFIVRQIKLTSYSIPKEVAPETELEDDRSPLVQPINLTKEQRISGFKDILPKFDILKSTRLARRFHKRAQYFFKDSCKIRFFMTWISSSSSTVFGDREFLAVDALFKSNPDSCLMILSNTMDSVHGFRILKHLTDRGYRVQAITPDLDFLFKNTPAQSWLHQIKNGKRDPGKIPLAQNLSNLIRLAILYKYGGVYLDTDFVILKDFSSLKNSIGAQSATPSGNWTRLNNAVLIFDKNHDLLYKFMEEFASTFNGNRWGYNGPYLVSRVVEREETTVLKLNFRVLPPMAFYPVDWVHVGGFFTPPTNRVHRRWVEAKMGQLSKSTYGVHLWNKQSSRFKIEEGSIMARLIANHCVICNIK
ncbi:uncharacterized protein At4g19900-like [Cynara cardunculus var. scolymus]|uniref:Alpha 1,4-glycosyltransferase domain-containing protein n=1 Tax=Cynara cardunculus var. scolymus TaxID=59895 RepID=A0A103Y6C6_CYNCS|nr:uncharacterized protein At4g19900-like [Cynara cardunculus var. scolymus]KVI03341.1 Alpha 1,4-glycosyltransferase domain-containing protein [Cynara cardunculus var. scolymus]